MKSLAKILAAAVLLCGVCPVGNALAAGHEIGLVKSARGGVTIARSAGTVPAVPGLALAAGDEVTTDADGAVGMAFSDGTRVSLGPGSRFLVRDYAFSSKEKTYVFQMYMKKGTMVYASGKLARVAPESIAIQTPQSTVGVRGTKLLIRVD